MDIDTDTDTPRQNRSDGQPTVLLVEDDRDLAETYRLWLESECDVRTADSGAAGLTWYDAAVDVVLLDRRLPDLSGERVLRSMERRDVDDQKAMLTSVAPGAELADLPCDKYLTKPVERAALLEAVEELDRRSRLDDAFQRHYALRSKVAALRASDAPESDRTADTLEQKAEQARSRVEDRLDDLDGFESAVKIIE